MKRNLLLTIGIFLCLIGYGKDFSPNDHITFEPVDPMTKVLREMNYFGNFKDMIDVAKGESATFQFAVRSGMQIKNLKVNVVFSNGNEKLNNVSARFIEYARAGNPVPESGIDAIRPTSLYYPDPILEDNSINLKRDITQPIWVRVNVPKDAKSGLYKGTITITGEIADQKFSMSKNMELTVHNVVLNTPRLWVTHWYALNPIGMKTFYGKDCKMYSKEYWDLLEMTGEKMAYCYQNMSLVPIELIDVKVNGDQYEFDFSNFDKTINILDKYGVLKLIEGGHIAKRIGDWNSKFGVNIPTGEYNESGEPIFKIHAYDSHKGNNYLKQFLTALVSHLKANGWYDRYTQHIADEPTEDNADSYIAISKMVKNYAPDIKIIEACHSKDLENAIDIWVPQLNFYKEGIEFYKERQKAGDQVWFYTCLGPQGNFVNRFLEQPLMKTRLIHWVNYRFGATGYLHWGLYYWGNRDPFERTTHLNGESGNTLPGGDCWIVYPKDGKMLGSIRLDAMRDGIADHELLKMLEEKSKPLADELCRQMVYNWTVYELEPYRLREIRRKILTELSK